jgi:NAD(P)-dependent dehydrogenase (short-subunit alcohol dehydrogenase family)
MEKTWQEGTLLKGNVTIVFGGAGLIGKSLVQAILRQGGIAIIADHDKEKGQKTCEQIAHRDIYTLSPDFFQVDVTDKSSIQAIIKKVAEKYGKIGGMINCAYPRNKNYGKSFFEVEYKDLCENLNLHLGGFFLVAQQVGEFFIKQGYGNMINLSSIYGVVPPIFEIYDGTTMTNPIEYGLIKSALIHMNKYMAKFFKGKNIRTNTISPGGILDGQSESFLTKYQDCCLSKGMLDTQDLHGTIIYLLSDMSKFVNGQNFIVDDGFTL